MWANQYSYFRLELQLAPNIFLGSFAKPRGGIFYEYVPPRAPCRSCVEPVLGLFSRLHTDNSYELTNITHKTAIERFYMRPPNPRAR